MTAATTVTTETLADIERDCARASGWTLTRHIDEVREATSSDDAEVGDYAAALLIKLEAPRPADARAAGGRRGHARQPDPDRRLRRPGCRLTLPTSSPRPMDTVQAFLPAQVRAASWQLPVVVSKLASRVINTARLWGIPEHQRRVRNSRRVLATIRSFRGKDADARVYAYLRKIDPFVYEEVIMSALEDAGAIVLRSRRYTGDGGVDGRCWFPWAGWRTVAVQAKRYQSTITPGHVRSFSSIVRAEGYAGGFFVHCGRSGSMTYEALRGQPVQLLSGSRMLSLLLRAYV